MALPFATVGGKITASFLNAIIGFVNAQYGTAVVPASVAGTGVTSGTNGKVTFTGASSIAINQAFTSTYDNYVIELDVTSASASVDIFFRFRSGGTDDASAVWTRAYQDIASATPATTFASAQTAAVVASAPATSSAMARIEVHSPMLAQRKYLTADGGSPLQSRRAFGTAGNVLNYDGFSIFPASGTLTGTLRIHGINNN